MPKYKYEEAHYITFCWITCGFMQLATLQFEMKMQKCIRMELTILRIFILGGIWSDRRSEIMFTALLRRLCKTKFGTVYPMICLPNIFFEYSYPQLFSLLLLTAKVTILANDDSSGYIYFNSEELITLEEPTGDNQPSTFVDLVILRGPGMYGEVNVPYKVVPDKEGNSNDITPMEGTVKFMDTQVIYYFDIFNSFWLTCQEVTR